MYLYSVLQTVHHVPQIVLINLPQIPSYSRRPRNLKSCQVIASYKSNLLGEVDFLLRSGFQVFSNFFILLEIEYLVTIIYEYDNYFRDITKQCLIGLHLRNNFLIGGLVSLWSHGFTIFQSRIPKWLLSNSVPVLK